MPCYFLKKYRRSDLDKWVFALVSEWVIMSDGPSAAVDMAERQLKIAGFEWDDTHYAVLIDYKGAIIWDRGP